MKASDIFLDGFDYSSKTLLEWVVVTGNHTLKASSSALVDISAPITIYLPENPGTNDEARIVDAKGTFNTNNVTVKSDKRINGVNGVNGDVILDKKDAYVSFVYTGESYGWKYNVNNINSIVGVPVDTSTLEDGYALAYDLDNDKFIMKQLMPASELPVLSGPSTNSEQDDVDITISNYISSATYTINVSHGTYNRVNGTITWTLPDVEVDTPATMTVTSEEPGKSISPEVVHNLTIEKLEPVGDDFLLVEGSDFNDWVESGSDYTYGSVKATADAGWFMSVPEYQGTGETDWTSVQPKVRVKTDKWTVKSGSTTSQLKLDSGPRNIVNSEKLLLINSDNSIATMENNVSSQSSALTSIAYGSSSTYSAGVVGSSYGGNSITKLDSSHIIVCYRDINDSGKGKAVIGTVGSSSTSYGTTYTFNENSTTRVSCIELSASTFVVCFADSNGNGKARIGTVSNGVITFGSAATYHTASVTYWNIPVKLSSTKFCIGFISNATLGVVVGDISGDTITFGILQSFISGSYLNQMQMGICALTSTKIVVSYLIYDAGWNSYSKVGDISGTTISFGPAYNLVMNADGPGVYCLVGIDSTSFIALVSKFSNHYARVGTVSGTAISWGADQYYSNTMRLARGKKVASDIIAVGSPGNLPSDIDYGNSNAGTNQCILIQKSGNSLSVLGTYNFTSGEVWDFDVVGLDDNSSLAICFKEGTNAAGVGKTISGSFKTYTVNLTTPIAQVPTKVFGNTPDLYFKYGTSSETIATSAFGPSTKLTPTLSYYPSSDSIEMQYSLIDFETVPNIRQLKFYMDFNKTNDELIYVYADLYKKQ